MDFSRGKKRRSWGVTKIHSLEDVEEARRRGLERNPEPPQRRKSVSARKPKQKIPFISSRKTKRSESVEDAVKKKKTRVTAKVAEETFKPGRVYLFAEGHLTGDIWHIAGAQLLLRQYGKEKLVQNGRIKNPLKDCTLVVAIMYWETKKNENKTSQTGEQIPDPRGDHVGYGRFLWEYLKDMGLPVVMVKFRHGIKSGQKGYALRKSLVKYDFLEGLYRDQKNCSPSAFDQVYNSYDPGLIVTITGLMAQSNVGGIGTSWTTTQSDVVAAAPPAYGPSELQNFVLNPDQGIVASELEDEVSDAGSVSSASTALYPVPGTGATQPAVRRNNDDVFDFDFSARKPPVEKIPVLGFDNPDIVGPPEVQEMVVDSTGDDDAIQVDKRLQWYYVLAYDVSTSIMMQMIARIGFEKSSKWLARALWWTPNSHATLTNEEVEAWAMRLWEQLVRVMTKASQAMKNKLGLNDAPSVILFAWRHSKYNKQTNATANLYKFVQDLINKREDNKSVLVTINLSQEETGNDFVFSLYNPPFIDRRVIACFWTKVAGLQKPSKMSPHLLGVIGGRSGCLDIAAFAGVKVIEWDICLFNDSLSSEQANRLPKHKINQQAPYGLRIVNMKPYLWVVFLDYRKGGQLLTVPPSMYGTNPGQFRDVVHILESGRTPAEQIYPLEGTGNGDMKTNLTRLGSALVSLDAPWVNTRLVHMNEYRHVSDAFEENKKRKAKNAAIARAEVPTPPVRTRLWKRKPKKDEEDEGETADEEVPDEGGSDEVNIPPIFPSSRSVNTMTSPGPFRSVNTMTSPGPFRSVNTMTASGPSTSVNTTTNTGQGFPPIILPIRPDRPVSDEEEDVETLLEDQFAMQISLINDDDDDD